MNDLMQALNEAASGALDVCRSMTGVNLELSLIWSESPSIGVAPQFPDCELTGISYSIESTAEKRGPAPTPWAIAFTPTFRRSVSGSDKKLQGRVLTALAELSEAPTKAHGDTVKPLSGELRGLWRYRVGDYRLVYEPREETRIVVLLEFAARSSVYE
jgi:addiction module RelE/StbE family toxin